MQELLNGSQFQKLLDKDSAKLREKYNLRKIDFQIIKYISRDSSFNTAKDLVELGIFTEEEVVQSLERLHKQNLIDFVKDKEDLQVLGLQITKAGRNLWGQIQSSHQHATEVLFRGMTEEQVKTFQRLSRIILDNIETELKEA